jgi:tRNA threonylcarbamoyladenosine biosynthesis protein TsaB
MLLAIDTSTEMAGLALVQDGRLLAELTWHCGLNHTIQLLPQLNSLLDKIGANLQSVTGIVVARGPGSFNGLRVGISTAKGLAFSLNVPIVGICTLEAAAYQHAETGLPIRPISGAGRGEIATATYQRKRNKWQQLTPEHLTTPEKLIDEIQTRTVFCGEYIPLIAAELVKRLGSKAVIPPYSGLIRRAGFLAELGEARLKAGNSDNIATLQPLYLRKPPITERKHT